MKQIKSLILTLSIVLVLFVSSNLTNQETQNLTLSSFNTTSLLTEITCHHGQCHATAKSTGNRCLHCVSKSGDYYCWQHK